MTEAISTEAIWNALSQRVRSFIAGRVSSQSECDDVLQDTFLKIHQRLGTLDDQDRLAAWVLQIARNTLYDHYRRKGNSPSLQTMEWHESQSVGVVTGAGDPENLNELVTSWLPVMIDQLPIDQQQAVRLYEIEGISQSDIASRLGISVSGAKSRIQRGRKKLKQLLLDCCTFQLDRRGNVIDYQSNDDDCNACSGQC